MWACRASRAGVVAIPTHPGVVLESKPGPAGQALELLRGTGVIHNTTQLVMEVALHATGQQGKGADGKPGSASGAACALHGMPASKGWHQAAPVGAHVS